MVREYDTNFASRYDSKKNIAENMLGIINEYYQRAVAAWENDKAVAN